MNGETKDARAKGAAETGARRVFHEPQLKVYGRIADLTLTLQTTFTLKDDAKGSGKTGL